MGTKTANAFGLHDVHGNVWEWCEDVYDSVFYRGSEAAGPDPLCTSGSMHRVFRGGSWNYGAWGCRSALRGGAVPDFRRDDLGFRPAYGLLP